MADEDVAEDEPDEPDEDLPEVEVLPEVEAGPDEEAAALEAELRQQKKGEQGMFASCKRYKHAECASVRKGASGFCCRDKAGSMGYGSSDRSLQPVKDKSEKNKKTHVILKKKKKLSVEKNALLASGARGGVGTSGILGLRGAHGVRSGGAVTSYYV